MDAQKLRDLTATLIAQLAERDAQINERDAELRTHAAQLASRDEELKRRQLKIDQLTHEMATLKRWQYGRHSEQLDAVQRSLLDESIDADIEAISLEIEALREKPVSAPKSQPRRVALPASLPAPGNPPRARAYPVRLRLRARAHRRGHQREARTICPGVFTVERHIRGKWVCRQLRDAHPGAAATRRSSTKASPTAGLLAQVLIAKYLRSSAALPPGGIFGRAGLAIPRSTLAHGSAPAGCSCSHWSMRSTSDPADPSGAACR